MTARQEQHEKTRRAILDAVAEVIASSDTGFSVQEVADRAGVTHRTVYNHFPTREALNDAFAVHVEEALAAADGGQPPDESLSADTIASMADDVYAVFERRSAYAHAYVRLMVASGAPARVTRERTDRIARTLERDLDGLSREDARLCAAALRMFLSATAWHLMTQHLGLTSAEAGRTAAWAMKTLLRAIADGDHPVTEEPT